VTDKDVDAVRQIAPPARAEQRPVDGGTTELDRHQPEIVTSFCTHLTVKGLSCRSVVGIPLCHFRGLGIQRFTHLNDLCQRRLGSSRRSLVFLGLTLAVFTWGLQYKLSLYNSPHDASRQIPQAKLLSRNEQAMEPDSPLTGTAKAGLRHISVVLPAVLLFFWIRLSLFREAGCAGDGPDGSRPRRVRSFASLSAFFFRPPPVAI
jgi:hypothetical protein